MVLFFPPRAVPSRLFLKITTTKPQSTTTRNTGTPSDEDVRESSAFAPRPLPDWLPPLADPIAQPTHTGLAVFCLWPCSSPVLLLKGLRGQGTLTEMEMETFLWLWTRIVFDRGPSILLYCTSSHSREGWGTGHTFQGPRRVLHQAACIKLESDRSQAGLKIITH